LKKDSENIQLHDGQEGIKFGDIYGSSIEGVPGSSLLAYLAYNILFVLLSCQTLSNYSYYQKWLDGEEAYDNTLKYLQWNDDL